MLGRAPELQQGLRTGFVTAASIGHHTEVTVTCFGRAQRMVQMTPWLYFYLGYSRSVAGTCLAWKCVGKGSNYLT